MWRRALAAAIAVAVAGAEDSCAVSFAAHVISDAADAAWSVFAIDVDGDGDVDVLSASKSDNTVAWYENDGSQSLDPASAIRGARAASFAEAPL